MSKGSSSRVKGYGSFGFRVCCAMHSGGETFGWHCSKEIWNRIMGDAVIHVRAIGALHLWNQDGVASESSPLGGAAQVPLQCLRL